MRFRQWQASLDVVPAIASLRARAEEIRQAELAKSAARLSEHERLELDSITTRILNKLLHLPTVRMKEAAVTADGVAYAEAVRHLFGLEEERVTDGLPEPLLRPLPVVAPSLFLRVRKPVPACGPEPRRGRVALCSYASGRAALSSR